MVSHEPTSDLQVVANVLELLKSKRLDETEFHVSGSQIAKALPRAVCLDLIKPFFQNSTATFCTINVFLSILSNQLRAFAQSPFFRERNLRFMIGGTETGARNTVRSDCVKSLIKVSREFCQAEEVRRKQHNTLGHHSTLDCSLSQISNLVSWEDSNHLLMIFQRQTGSVSFIYRDPAKVDAGIRQLMQSQRCDPSKDWAKQDHSVLVQELDKICGVTNTLESSYVVTADNLLKMCLILMRIDSGLPVVIMGETGCGKTSLVKYLAQKRDALFEVKNLHAGVSESDLCNFIEHCELEVDKLQKPIWVFLDEINACDHLGLIADLMCHRRLMGRRINSMLVLIAACNPYRWRRKLPLTAGLDAKMAPKLETDRTSRLVYRVHPLPETLLEYIWDFGSLNAIDEGRYIESMLRPIECPRHFTAFCSLVRASQEFMRTETQEECSVSLRDVRRVVKLVLWFKEHRPSSKTNSSNTKWMEACVLALLHNYHARLPNSELRRKYRDIVARCLRSHDAGLFPSEESIHNFLVDEQLRYLTEMQIDPGTARNEALRENIFVVLVSILNCIPVFLVGKPGCSKSLSMQLIETSLRGADSLNPFFKSLPAIFQISYQGSESSTSDGILRVFEKAHSYKENNQQGVIPLVLLDEVGLAEISPFNPLKVLHSLLEPDTPDQEQVSRIPAVIESSVAVVPCMSARLLPLLAFQTGLLMPPR